MASHHQEPAAPRTVPSSELFNGRREIIIRHDGASYRLRITSNNRLIMTK